MAKVDRNSFVPVYYQIAEGLKQKIRKGSYCCGEKLPVEERLASEYGVTRVTLRRALDKLTLEGFVRRVRSKGTFVEQFPVERKHVVIFGADRERFHISTAIAQITSGCVMRLQEDGCTVQIESTRNVDAVLDQVRKDALVVDGALLLRPPAEDGSVLEKLAKAGIPVVCEGRELGRFSVEIDNCKAIEKAIDYLLDLGHRKIGLAYADLAGRQNRHAMARLAAFRDIIQKRLNYCDESMLFPFDFWFPFSPKSIEQAFECATAVLQSGQLPSAIVCVSDFIAASILRQAPVAGIRIPDDLSVVGFDDTEMCPWLQPALTTIRQDYVELGSEAAGLLLSLLRDADGRRRHIKVEPELIVRDSCHRIKSLYGSNQNAAEVPVEANL